MRQRYRYFQNPSNRMASCASLGVALASGVCIVVGRRLASSRAGVSWCRLWVQMPGARPSVPRATPIPLLAAPSRARARRPLPHAPRPQVHVHPAPPPVPEVRARVSLAGRHVRLGGGRRHVRLGRWCSPCHCRAWRGRSVQYAAIRQRRCSTRRSAVIAPALGSKVTQTLTDRKL